MDAALTEGQLDYAARNSTNLHTQFTLNNIRIGVLIAISCNVVLNAAFALIRLPPGGIGVPTGELLILGALVAFLLNPKFTRRFLNSIAFTPLFTLWLIGIAHLISDVPVFGFWAIRDSAHLIETAYLWIGFRIAVDTNAFSVLYRWLRILLTVSAVYLFTYPFRDGLDKLSPQIKSAGGYSLPLFFSYTNASSGIIAGVAFSLLEWSRRRRVSLVVAVTSLVILVTLVQVRVVYIQLFLLCILLVCFAPQRLVRAALLFGAGFIGILVFASLDLDITGRLGTRFSLSFLSNHLQAIWGGGDESVKAAADGVELRLNWWEDIYRLIFSDPLHFCFGVGFGLPLTSFVGPDGDITREPHNSFMSVLGRYGVVGLSCFLAVQFHIYSTAIKSIYLSARLKQLEVYHFLVTIVVFLSANLVFSLVEGGFEVSYVAIPYYFFAGVIYAIHSQLRAGATLIHQGKREP